MSILMRTIALALAIGSAGAALAGDAYYDVPIHELRLVDGNLPTRKNDAGWSYHENARVYTMRPYAALDGPGEVYIAGHGEEGDTWYLRYATGPDYTRALIRAPEGTNVAGRLFVPNSDLTDMVVLKFTVPASAAKPEAKVEFQQAKIAHYENLFDRDIPGGAWFRYQARLARAESRLPPRSEPRPAVGWRPDQRDQLVRTYELFTGGRAMSENLQLDRTLPPMRPNEMPVKIDSLTGITIQEIDWKALDQGRTAEAGPPGREDTGRSIRRVLPQFPGPHGRGG